MAVTMNDVRAALDPEEPNYTKAAKLGAAALPHLEALVSSGDSMLASKATYLAALINDAKSAKVVTKAAQHADPVVRVAAAAAAARLGATHANAVLLDLVGDPDPGVRKVARASAPARPSAQLAKKLDDAASSAGTGAEAAPVGSVPLGTGLMPGEKPREGDAGMSSTMPGEMPSAMPGEGKNMPGR